MKLPLFTAFIPQLIFSVAMGVTAIVIFSDMHSRAVQDAMEISVSESLRFVEEKVASPFSKATEDTWLMHKAIGMYNGRAYLGNGRDKWPNDVAYLERITQLIMMMLHNSKGTYFAVYQGHRLAEPYNGTWQTRLNNVDYPWGDTGCTIDYCARAIDNATVYRFNNDSATYPYVNMTIASNELWNRDLTEAAYIQKTMNLDRNADVNGSWGALEVWVDPVSEGGKLWTLYSFFIPVTFDSRTGQTTSAVTIDIDCKWLVQYIESIAIPVSEVTIVEPQVLQVLASSYQSLRPGFDEKTGMLWSVAKNPEPRLVESYTVITEHLGGTPLDQVGQGSVIVDDGDEYIVSMRPIRQAQLNLVILMSTEKDYYFEDGFIARRNAIVICSALLVASVALSILTAVIISRPIRKATRDVLRSARLAVTEESAVGMRNSVFLEIHRLQKATASMMGLLSSVKQFVPQTVLRNSLEFARKGGEDFVNPISGLNDEDFSTNSGSEGFSDLAVDESALTSEINTFHSQLLSTLQIIPIFDMNVSAEQLGKLSQVVMNTVVPYVMRCKGVIELQRPDAIIVTFSRGLHTERAALCAMYILSTCARLGIRIVQLIDRDYYQRGACGTHQRKAFVTVGPWIHERSMLLELAKQRLGTPILASEVAAGVLPSHFIAIPVDKVKHPIESVLYELRLGKKSDGDEAAQLRVAFSSMLSGDFSSAVAVLGQLQDIHAKRLVEVCKCAILMNMQEYYRNVLGWQLLGEKGEVEWSKNVVTWEEHDEQLEDLAEDAEHIRMAVRQKAVEDAVQINDAAEDLFTVVDAGTTREERLSARAPEIPSVVTDVRGARWLRSKALLGDGTYSKVYSGMNECGHLVTLKVVDLESRNITEDRVINEVSVLSKCHHTNIASYVSLAIQSPFAFVIMEYVAGGSLRSAIDNWGSEMPTSAVKRFGIDILRGLAFLHDRDIIHGDIKASNVLIGAESVCKLTDFGSAVANFGHNATDDVNDTSTDLADDDPQSKLVPLSTVLHMAPEFARSGTPSRSSDVWAFGILLHEMLTGELPWSHASSATENVVRFRRRLAREAEDSRCLRPVQTAHPDPVAVQLVSACLADNPTRRPTAKQLLGHGFFL